MGAYGFMLLSRASMRSKSDSSTRSVLLSSMRSAKAICSTASFSTPSGFSSSRWASMCLASISVTMPSSRAKALTVVDEECLRYGRRIGQPRRLDDDPVELQAAPRARGELLEHADQVLPHGAADAAVHHLDELLLGLHLRVLLEQLVVNADLAELVLDDRELLAVRGRQDVVEERRLAAAEEA